MSVEEILNHQPELKAPALFVANHLLQIPSATINYVHAVWENHSCDCFTLDDNLDWIHWKSRYLFSHGFFSRKKLIEYSQLYVAAAAPTAAAAAAAAQKLKNVATRSFLLGIPRA
jgi:hypothetical protein